MAPQVMTLLMIEPSSWLRSGITIERIDGINLIKFTNNLYDCLEELLERRKAGALTPS